MDNKDELLSAIRDAMATSPEPQREIVRLIREFGPFRWVGLYAVDPTQRVVRNIAWDGPAAPEFPVFPLDKGLTGSAIATRETVNVGDVANDPRYLTALGSTRSEIIVPVLDLTGETVIGTIDVESEQPNAFNPETQSLLESCATALKPLWSKI